MIHRNITITAFFWGFLLYFEENFSFYYISSYRLSLPRKKIYDSVISYKQPLPKNTITNSIRKQGSLEQKYSFGGRPISMVYDGKPQYFFPDARISKGYVSKEIGNEKERILPCRKHTKTRIQKEGYGEKKGNNIPLYL